MVKATLLLHMISVGMWLLPFPALRRLVTWIANIPLGRRRMERVPANRVAWAVEAASQHLTGGKTCLNQALAAQMLLTRRGHPATVRIGAVRDEGGEFEAHAWVESRGEVVIGGHELERYTQLIALEGAGS